MTETVTTEQHTREPESAAGVNPTSEHASEQSVSHEVTLFAEPVWHFGNFTVTNSYLNSSLVVVLLAAVALVFGRKAKRVPSKLQTAVEVVLEGALSMADSVTGSRAKTVKIFPFVFALFVFVVVNNWLGLLPGVGSIGFIEQAHGESVFVPLLRGATADLNTTLALAIASVIGANIFGAVAVGFWQYADKFLNFKEILQIPRRILKEPAIIIVAPIKVFVGLIEIVGEFAKVASLSLRLFGNIFAGEVLLTAIAVIFAFILPIPFMFLEVIVGIIQALIFSMLTLVYFSVASESHGDHEAPHEAHQVHQPTS